MPIPLSISAGSAVFPHDGDSYESLLAKADSRMYRDKVARKSESQTRLAEHGSSTVPPDARAKVG
jgi:predicted signal transduction protein with EAL and GGDEF domain